MLLLVLDLCNLIRVLVVPVVPSPLEILSPAMEQATPEPSQITPRVAVQSVATVIWLQVQFICASEVMVVALISVVIVMVVVVVVVLLVRHIKGRVMVVVIVMTWRELMPVQRFLQQFSATTRWPGDNCGVFRGTLHQGIRVRRRVSVAEVRTMPTPADSTRHSGLFYGLADHHAVLLELLSEDRVEKGIAARIQREDEDCEHFGLFQRDQVQSKGCSERQECDRRPADKVGEYEQSHSLSDPGVVAVPGLRPANRAVHLQVAAHQDEKRHAIDEHQEDNVGQTSRSSCRLKGQANGELSVIRDSKEWQNGHSQRESPANRHDVSGMSQG